MDIKKLIKHVEKQLGAPTYPIQLHEEYIKSEIELAEEEIKELGLKFLSGNVRNVWIRKHVTANTKINLGRIGHRFDIKTLESVKDVVDYEQLMVEGYEELDKLLAPYKGAGES
jgi:hypothetical protein